LVTALLYGIGEYGPFVLAGRASILSVGQFLQLGVATFLLTGIGVVLYDSRYRQYDARRRAEAMRDEVAELESAKSRFFANLSHELRTPLTLILGPLQDVLEGRYGDLPDSLRQRLRAMKEQAERLRTLVTQLLWLSELDEGKRDLEARPIQLDSFLDRMASLFRSMADQEGVTVRVDADGSPSVCADPEALRRIVSNLLSNALEHTPEGGAVRIRARARTEGSEKWTLVSVRDSGPGLPDEVQDTLFERYAGTGASGSDLADVSLGIGLALVKELAERHGGRVEVESEQDFGTEITVVLPRSCASLPAGDVAPDPESAPDATVEPEVRHTLGTSDAAMPIEPGTDERDETPSQEKPTVLAVDDEAAVRDYLQDVLAPRYAVTGAEDGEEALQAARADTPDLVISDVRMPRLDGYELCQALRADETLRTVPIILLTVQKSAESRMEGLRQGADAYLEKPFRPEELRQRVENLIDVRQYIRAEQEDGATDDSGSATGDPPSSSVADQSDFAAKVRDTVEGHLENSSFGVEWLADEMDLSTRHLQRRLKAEAGLSAAAFIRAVRLERAADLLDRGEVQTVREAASAVGYRDPSHFSRLFKEAHGQSPSNLKS
jgi:signal transduction histidine kinase/CheY-like chemotaxis protein